MVNHMQSIGWFSLRRRAATKARRSAGMLPAYGSRLAKAGNRSALQPGLLALLLVLTGCDRNEVKVYRLAKDAPPSPASASAESQPTGDIAGHDQGKAAAPRLSWTLPGGWEQKPPGEMRAASFAVTGKDGGTADVSVIPLPAGGSELDLVNMWRQQMRLPPIAIEAADKQAEPVTIGSDPGKLFDIASEEPVFDGKSRARIFVGMVTRGPTSWFFKMTGEDSFVREQKPVFVQFLKSISFHSDAPAEPVQFADTHHFLSTNAKQAPSENSEKPIWVVPPDWREVPPTQFLLAKFEVTGAGDGKADVSVSMLGGAGGGLLANVNRWRRQLGLEPVDDEGLAKLATSVDLAGGKAVFVDMNGTDARTGQPARMIGAVVPQTEQTWFYKLMGNEKTVEKERKTFTKFVRTIKYPNAP